MPLTCSTDLLQQRALRLHHEYTRLLRQMKQLPAADRDDVAREVNLANLRAQEALVAYYAARDGA